MDIQAAGWSFSLLIVLSCFGLREAQEDTENYVEIPLKIPDFTCVTNDTVASPERIPVVKVCDGTPDCTNSADENLEICQYIRCPPSYFQCEYGACVRRARVCDGVNDCMDKSDEAYCGRDVESCDVQDYHCKSGQCIKISTVCDGRIDCDDGTDESVAVCSNFPCPTRSFRCSYGGCVSLDATCNGVADCHDKSDELATLCKGNCSTGVSPKGDGKCVEGCKKNEFRCASGACIAQKKTCDGVIDCAGDGADESSVTCSTFHCPSYAFRCTYGACIKATQACDGVPDCADGSDENPDLCGIQRPEGSCILPPFPANGRHNIAVGAYVPNYGVLNFSCNAGFTLKGANIIYCSEGLYVPEPPTCELVVVAARCPPLKSRHLNLECFLISGARHPCDVPAPEGTRATYSCRQFFIPTVNTPNRASTCKDGKWSRELLNCEPECGNAVGEVTPLVVNGTEAKYGEWPWQAALYVRVTSGWEFQCGGSLITENIVLTAAHCVWEVKPQAMVIGIGKYFRQYDKRQELTQMKELKEIVMNPNYIDKQGNYDSDIALLILSSPVVLSAVVQPVCIVWEEDLVNIDLSDGPTGTVVGWGVTENDLPSEIPRKANLPVIGSGQCRKALPQDFGKYIRSTTFCAGYLNRTSVCNGDSGGGLMVQTNGKWWLQGVVSVSPRRKDINLCDSRYYAIFTRVSSYSKWISDEIANYIAPP